MHHRRIGIVLLCALLWLMAGCGQESELPEAEAGFYVLDEAQVLTEETETHIVAVNDVLSAATGAQLVVVCVQTTGLMSIEEYARDLFNEWEIGDREMRNGILMLLSIGEEEYWVLQGEGLEDSLSSGTISLMNRQYLEPSFAAGDYDGGVNALFDALIHHLEQLYSVEITDDAGALTPAEDTEEVVEERESSDLTILGWAIILVIVILLLIGRFGGNGGEPRRRRPVTTPRPRRTGYPFGTRLPRTPVRPPIHRPTYRPTHRPTHRPGGFGGGGLGGNRPRGGFGGGNRSGGGGFTRGGGAGRR